jgi:quinol-cytochrome oxidoreductase complex cytochrome b subunit
METAYMSQFLGWVNVFISLFIILFAFSFFKKTEPHEDRKPWIFLLFSVIVFFCIELSGVIPATAKLTDYRNFLKTTFIAIVLYVFVFQYNLLNRADKIVINKKDMFKSSTLVQPKLKKSAAKKNKE